MTTEPLTPRQSDREARELVERLRKLLTEATPGPWDVWRERTDTRDAAVAELVAQVESTEPFAGAVFMLNADGKCPALTGCGPTSEANANLIVAAITALLDLAERAAHAEQARAEERERCARVAVLEAALAEAQFLCNRLDELDFSQSMEDFTRDHCGHVDPSHARLKSALAALNKGNKE